MDGSRKHTLNLYEIIIIIIYLKRRLSFFLFIFYVSYLINRDNCTVMIEGQKPVLKPL